jgi:hypothetical protein
MPHKLRSGLGGLDVATVQYTGFGGLKNGELLVAAEAAGFNVLLTGDKSLEYEQTLRGRNIAVVSLSAPHWPIIKDHVRRIVLAIEGASPGSFTRVECGSFMRPGRYPDPEPG